MNSFGAHKCRQGHMHDRQRCALAELWPAFGINEPGDLDLEKLFGRPVPCHLEIGFGQGDTLLDMALTHPKNNYLGVEVYQPGVANVLLEIQEKGITNVRLDRRNAMDVLDLLPDRSLVGVYLYFPDPWPKKRHHKRRLVQARFVEKLYRVLAPGGRFQAATDLEDYASQILQILDATNGFRNLSGPGNFHGGTIARPTTRYEKRGLTKGCEIHELVFERV
jgi:tRNA (guanine-N7-)-methyltransferase